MLERIRVFTGNANLELARKITENLGVTLGKAHVTAFSDGETRVEINENVRGMDVFIIQPTSPPVNDHLLDL
ncbi:MAG: ribose-phosphate pyrophosphokinase-like domain-containing protein, partial [Thermodesulfobacteriota bacterium]